MLIIRPVKLSDAAALSEIYRYYVENTACTFELKPPDEKEFLERIANTTKKYPYFTAELDGEILGYAYAGAFKQRAAYARSVETSIYIKHGLNRHGTGRALYNALENALKECNITNMYACIACPEKEDEYLNFNSMHFHEHCGFVTVGRFTKCANKFGRWYNMIWMEKIIGEHD